VVKVIPSRFNRRVPTMSVVGELAKSKKGEKKKKRCLNGM